MPRSREPNSISPNNGIPADGMCPTYKRGAQCLGALQATAEVNQGKANNAHLPKEVRLGARAIAEQARDCGMVLGEKLRACTNCWEGIIEVPGITPPGFSRPTTDNCPVGDAKVDGVKESMRAYESKVTAEVLAELERQAKGQDTPEVDAPPSRHAIAATPHASTSITCEARARAARIRDWQSRTPLQTTNTLEYLRLGREAGAIEGGALACRLCVWQTGEVPPEQQQWYPNQCGGAGGERA